MTIHRKFLGWDRPCLHEAATWLWEQYGDGWTWDLGSVAIVVPGRRSGRRLLEVLVDRAPHGLLTPPRIITTGELPELLYEPDPPVADLLTALLARAWSLRQADAQLLKTIVPEPPDCDDLDGYTALARDLADLDYRLATDDLPTDQVATRLQATADFSDHTRWQALSQLRRAYEQTLAQHGLQDQNTARFEAIRRGRFATDYDVVLLATVDLHGIARRMLEKIGDRVTALVHAPPSCADDFDPLGCLIVDRWFGQRVDLDRCTLHIVDRPRDQADQVLRVIEQIANDRYGADQITVGLGDETAGPMFEQCLEQAGIPARLATGRPVVHSRPAQLLAALARYTHTQRWDDFAALLRHPDLEADLNRQLELAGDDRLMNRSWSTLLDRYATDHLPQGLGEQWLGDASTKSRLETARARVASLLGDAFDQRKPLPQWSPVIAEGLALVYGPLGLERSAQDDADLIHALEAIAKALREQASLDADAVFTPGVTVSEAISLTLSRLSQQEIPAEGGMAAVELMGWLELQLDDAPMLIVTGFNEGYIPRSANADAFLPDHTRQVLGLEDNRRRYARDVMMLRAITHSRQHVTLIAGRRHHDEEPLAPSRLLLTGDEDRIAKTVGLFYKPDTENHRPQETFLVAGPGRESTFIIPPPHGPDKPITQLSVTAFRDYLACPYRFYLKHVLKLRALDDHAVEMDGRMFGDLAHEVLRRFGRSELAGSAGADAIRAYLSDQLDAIVRQRFGQNRLAAVSIQCEQLRHRFGLFARWQAQRVQAGWRIVPEHTEEKQRAIIDVDGEPFMISGRIDRIDVHPKHGYSILDYKTRDTAVAPEKTHRTGLRGNKTWIDLQLPLYRRLVQAIGIDGPVELGYIQLPKDQPRLAPAVWGQAEIDSAYEEVERIIRAVRDGRFWPPTDTPLVADEFSAVCLDGSSDRPHALARSQRLLREAGVGS